MGCAGYNHVEGTSCGADNQVFYKYIDGTPLKVGQPGSYEHRDIRTGPTFKDKLVDWVQTLKYFSKTYAGSWFNDLEFVGHIGATVCKDGCHGLGRAIDINYVKWNGYTVNAFGGDHASGDRTRKRRYLAVDACCRRYFQYTLDGWYNSAHENHIHVDNDGVPLLDKNSRSDTVFVQAVCNAFNSAGLSIDGSWGQNTQDAWLDINRAWGYASSCTPTAYQGHWADWCNQVMKHGFDDVGAGKYNSPCNEPA